MPMPDADAHQARAVLEGPRRRLPAARRHAGAGRVPARAKRPRASASIRPARRSSPRSTPRLRPGEGGDPRPGPVPRPRPGARPVLLGAARRADVPPSLHNIFKEIQRDLGLPRPDHGCLTAVGAAGRAAAQRGADGRGRPGRRAPGQGLGRLHRPHRRDPQPRARRPGVHALGQLRAGQGQDHRRPPALRAAAPHPSPLSAHRGFIGCGHFSAANRWLAGRRLAPIDWALPVPSRWLPAPGPALTASWPGRGLEAVPGLAAESS